LGTEIYPDGTTACHLEYPYRPDAKVSGLYRLPYDILISGTYQFTRGVQTGGAGPSIQANFLIPAASAAGLGARLSSGWGLPWPVCWWWCGRSACARARWRAS
jgi:hypothetical protein